MAETDIIGMPGLLSALRRIENKAATELRREFRTRVGGSFTLDVQQKIDSEGLVRSGRLRGSIKPTIRGGDLYIRSSPPLKPGRKSRQGYAPIYEYGHGGRRAFIEPVRQQWQSTGKLERELAGYLDWVAGEFRA